MKYDMMAELLFGLFANGIRFYAIKRYIDFFASKEKCQWKHNWILYVIGCVGTFAVSTIFVSPGLNIISNLLATLLLTVPYRVKWPKKLLMTFVIYVINALVDIIVVQSLTKYVPGEPLDQVYLLITSLVVLMITVFFKDRKDYEKDTPLPAIHVIVLGMIPLISIICIYSVAVMTDDKKPVVLTAAFSLIFINALLFYLYYVLMKFYCAQMNEKRLEQMNAVYEHQIDVMQESQEQMKKLRHDMKHHIIELSSMAQQDENKDMIQYLKQMEEFMLNPDEKVSTGNRDIDGILNYMLRQSDELLNTVNLDIQIPKQLYSKNFNICVILGNLVDNAVREASKSEEKYLSLSVRTKKDLLLILIENSYCGTIEKEDDRFKTSQGDSSIHGLGLESVKQVVASCDGDMKIEYTENRFRVQVMLYLSNM